MAEWPAVATFQSDCELPVRSARESGAMSQFIAVAKHRHAPERRIAECEDATKDLAVAAAVVFRAF